MRLNMYERTPKGTTPKWIKILLIAVWALFTSLFAFTIIILAIEDLATGFLVFATLFSCYFGFIVMAYNLRRAYMEIEGDTIHITDYPFFKERKKVVFLQDIQKIKWSFGGKGVPNYLVFKNHEGKHLFRTVDLPEIRACFSELGFEIT